MHGTVGDIQSQSAQSPGCQLFFILDVPFSGLTDKLVPTLFFNPDKLNNPVYQVGDSVSAHASCQRLDLTSGLLDDRHIAILRAMLQQPYKAMPDYDMREKGFTADDAATMNVRLTILCRRQGFPMPCIESDGDGSNFAPVGEPTVPKPSKAWPVGKLSV